MNQCHPAARVLTGASYDIHSADTIQTLSWDILDARWLRAKSTSMYKILNDNTAPNLRTLLLEGMLIRLITISEIVLQIWHFLHRRESFQREVLNIAAQCFGTNSQIRQNKRNRYIHLINVSKRNLVMSCHIVSQPAPPSRIYGILLLSHTPLTATAEKKILFAAIHVYSRGTSGSTEKLRVHMNVVPRSTVNTNGTTEN